MRSKFNLHKTEKCVYLWGFSITKDTSKSTDQLKGQTSKKCKISFLFVKYLPVDLRDQVTAYFKRKRFTAESLYRVIIILFLNNNNYNAHTLDWRNIVRNILFLLSNTSTVSRHTPRRCRRHRYIALFPPLPPRSPVTTIHPRWTLRTPPRTRSTG